MGDPLHKTRNYIAIKKKEATFYRHLLVLVVKGFFIDYQNAVSNCLRNRISFSK